MTGFFSLLTMRPAGVKALWSPNGLDEYRTHQSLWQVFSESPDDSRDFLYREKESDGTPTFYAVSRRAPKLDDPCWAVQTKPYAPVIAAGNRFALSLRLNACRSLRDEPRGKEVRHDAVMHFMKQNPDVDVTDARQEAAEAWLSERSERCGFGLHGIVVDSWEPRKLTPKGRSVIAFHALDVHGVIEVTDVDAFKKVLFDGLGRSRGFGCGLFLVRPLAAG